MDLFDEIGTILPGQVCLLIDK